MTLATIFGASGSMLVLVGLIGGGFTFSGSIMPKVGGWSRLCCFGVGGILLVTSLVVGVMDWVGPPAVPGSAAGGSPPPPTSTPSSEHPASEDVPDHAGAGASYIGYILVPPGRTALVFEEPQTSAAVVTELPDGSMVEIVCTVLGEAVTSPVTGAISTLWNGTTDGGFVPDALVYTGTDQPTMPNCFT